MTRAGAVALVLALVLGVPAGAQQRDTTARRANLQVGQPLGAQSGTPHYDVVVEVPELSVDELELDVSGLRAQLALDAQAARLVQLSAGAVVGIERVDLGLHGVLAEAYLYIDLDNVSHVIRRVVATIDRNPALLTRLLESTDSLVRATGNLVETVTQPGGVLSQTVNQLGQTVQQVVSSSGGLLERTVDASGRVLSERNLGQLLDLPVVRSSTNAAGQTVRTVRETGGRLLELTLDSAGRVAGARVVQR